MFYCRYLFSAIIQRALLAPMVWILVTLLDGKILICAFSVSVDPALFSGICIFPHIHIPTFPINVITIIYTVQRYIFGLYIL